jgi:hypothetical protein
MKAAHLRFSTWEGGVADFWSCGGCIKHLPGMPRTLANLLKRPEWRGATVVEKDGVLEISHPAGTRMRIRADAFEEALAALSKRGAA